MKISRRNKTHKIMQGILKMKIPERENDDDEEMEEEEEEDEYL